MKPQAIGLMALCSVLLTACPANQPATPSSPSPSSGAGIKGPTLGLVAYYPFEGNANDLSGNGQNGQTVGSVSFADNGRIGKALSLTAEGENSHVLVKHTSRLAIMGSLTLSAWSNVTQDMGETLFPIVTKGQVKEDYTLWAGRSGLELLMNWETENEFWAHGTESRTAANQWHLLTATYDGRMVVYYLDGEQMASYTNDKPIDASGEDLYIGTSYPGNLDRYPGLIDDLRIYNRALSAQEVRALFALR